MDRIQDLKKRCTGLNYEIMKDDVLMANAKIGSQHYGIEMSQCAPTFILKADEIFIALIIQGSRKIDFKKVEKYLGVKKAIMASRETIFEVTGAPLGSVSLINPELRTLIDEGVPHLPSCYGGCGVEKYTLKIKGSDLVKVTQGEVGEFTKEGSV